MTKNNILKKNDQLSKNVSGQYSIHNKKNNSVSQNAKWTSLSKKVLKENMEAWQTLAKE